MDYGYLLGVAASVLAICGTVWGLLRRAHRSGTTLAGRWAGKHIAPAVTEAATAHLRSMVTEELAPVLAQLSPNSGSSLADKVTRIDQWRQDFSASTATDLGEIKRHLTRQDRAMGRHLEAHAEHKAA